MHYVAKALKLILLFSSFVCSVDASDWKWIGPSAGDVSVVPDPNHSDVWYAINQRQLYRSTDNAQSWIQTNFMAENIFVHPLTSRLLISTFERGKTILSESRDFGRSFRRLAELTYVPAIAQDPTFEARLVGIRNNLNSQTILVSSDGGRTWKDVSSELPIVKDGTFNGCRVYDAVFDSVVFSPLEPGAIYISFRAVLLDPCNSRPSQILVSRDFGKSWKVEGNFEDSVVFIKDPYFSSRVFANDAGHRTYVFTESGLRFHSERSIGYFTSFPGNADHLLDVYGGLLESFDGGVTWSKVDRKLPPATYRVVAMRNPKGALLAVTGGGGLYIRKIEAGWKASNSGFKSAYTSTMAAAGTNVYSVVRERFVYHTSDSGRTWTDLSFRVPQGFEFRKVAINPFDPSNTILIGSRSSPGKQTHLYFVTFDYGRSWRTIFKADYASRVQFHPLIPNVVYFYREDGIHKSDQRGLNPRKLTIKDIKPYKISFDLTNPSQLFFVTCSQIYRSFDEGKTIEMIGSEIELDGVCFTDVTKSPEEYYLTADGWSGIFRSLGVGRKWKNIAQLPRQTGGGGDPSGSWRFFPADSNGDHIFALSHGVLYQTFDRGFHWRRVKPQVAGLNPIREIFEMSDPRKRPIYLATDQGILMQR